MQNAIPAAPELQLVTLIPEVKVRIGQNQIRRHVGWYTENYSGEDVRTHNAQIAAGQTLTLEFDIKALVLSCSAPIDVSMTYGGGVKDSVNKLLVWDQPITKLVLDNGTTEQVEVQLSYIVETPVVTGT